MADAYLRSNRRGTIYRAPTNRSIRRAAFLFVLN